MTGPTIGQQLDATLANLVTKDDITDLKAELKADMAGLKSELKAEMKAFVTHEQLNTIIKAAVRELVQVINQNTEDLREDLNDAGRKIRTKVRDRSGYSADPPPRPFPLALVTSATPLLPAPGLRSCPSRAP
jgi:hypothetical protein